MDDGRVGEDWFGVEGREETHYILFVHYQKSDPPLNVTQTPQHFHNQLIYYFFKNISSQAVELCSIRFNYYMTIYVVVNNLS